MEARLDVVLFAGQSNALGAPDGATADYTPSWRVQMWTDVDGDGVGDIFLPLIPGWNTGTPANPRANGPEVEFARQWLLAHPGPDDTLYIGKLAKGETPLAASAGLDWSPESQGEMFDRAQLVAARMMAALGVDHLSAVFWMQGETDATNPDWAAHYADHLRAFLTAVRAEWMHDPDGYIGLGRITDSAALAYNFDVRVAQWQVDQEDPHTESFKTIGYEMQPDDLHYDATGQAALGRAFFDNWAMA